MMWLSDCGLIHLVNCVKVPKYPLKAYEDLSAFKLFILEVGLLAEKITNKSEKAIDSPYLLGEISKESVDASPYSLLCTMTSRTFFSVEQAETIIFLLSLITKKDAHLCMYCARLLK